ncbi:methyl-accepting chemotaxis protein [Gammaproteobacteria bacterium]
MRSNKPITMTEQEVKEGVRLISKTDLLGNITYINPPFLVISGHKEKEVLGSPHNLMHHPDIPESVFTDLWAAVRRGEPWTGLLKNRCKNGDFYWIEANLTPIREGGRIAGYMSVATRPTRTQIELAERRYREIREGRNTSSGVITAWKNFLHHLSLRTRVMSGMAVLVLANLLVVSVLLTDEYGDLMEGHRSSTRKLVESAYSIADYFQHQAQLGSLPENTAKSAALALLRNIRYDGNIGYLWVNDFSPKMVMHPYQPNLEGKDLTDVLDPSGKRLFVEFVKIAREKKSGFLEYLWPKPGIDVPLRKISYVKGFEPWGWVIGSGIYVDEVDAVFHQELLIHGGAVLSITLLLVLLAWFALRSVRHPLLLAIGHFEAIAEGRYDQRVEVKRRDELGHLLLSLKAMKIKLSVDMSESNRRANEAKRVQTALDHVSTNVMIANPDGEIIYLNQAVLDMFINAESDIRKELPRFSAHNLLGRNFDEFHRNPMRQRTLLENLKGTHHTHIVIGGRHFNLVANPISNEEGYRLGTVVEWSDVTELTLTQNEIEVMVQNAQSGELNQRLDLEGKDGFFKTLANTFNRLLDTVESVVADTVTALESLAEGNLTARINSDHGGDFARINQHFNATAEQLGNLVGSIRGSAQAVESASREIAVGNADLSKRTEQQAASLEETGATMEELTATVKQNAANAGQANQFAQSARDVAERGGERMSEVVRTMTAITESASKIANIISVIDGIAFQTNILALNAAVEAARAGEQGRGFSVVAAEVRALAQRSAAAAREIKGLIDTSNSHIKGGSRLVGEAGQAMNEIVGAVKRVTDLMAEISAASKEQSEGIEQINQAVAQMDEVTQQNAALVEEATAAAEGLTEQARELRMAVDVFRLQTEEA